MKTLRNTMPPGELSRRLPARKDARAIAADAARRDLPAVPGRVITVGPARVPSRLLNLPRHPASA